LKRKKKLAAIAIEGREEELGEYKGILTARRYHWISG
jgi:hypothetical protein